MKNNFKKYLSYVLSIVLAMGLGLSYAYAVGANDSNAFVTTTEWETKFDQIETSIDNVTKTINENNMDFVMNGPRLQVSMWEGLENVGYIGQVSSNTFGFQGLWYRQTDQTGTYNYFFAAPHLYISDQWDGRQAIANIGWGTGTYSYSSYPSRFRYALRSNDPNIYVIVYVYRFDSSNVYGGYYTYVDLSWKGSTPYYYAQAKTITFTVDTTKYRNLDGNAYAGATRRNQYVYAGTGYGYDAENWTDSNADSRESNQNGYITRTLTGTTATITLEYPANCNTLRHNTGWSVFADFPLDLKGKKFGTLGDSVHSGIPVSKVWSPQKNSLCLKNYLNGEIPILNE